MWSIYDEPGRPLSDLEFREMVKIMLSDALPASPEIWLEPGGLGGPRVAPADARGSVRP